MFPPSVRRGLLALLALCLTAALVPLAAGGPAAAASSSELTAKLNDLNNQLVQVQADEDALANQLVGERDRVAKGRPAYDAGVDAEEAAYKKLSRYAVQAYVAADVVDIDLSVAVLTNTSGDLEAEGRRVLATTVHGELVGQARNATANVDRLTTELHQAETAYTASQVRQSDLADRHAQLTADIARTQVELQQAREAEAKAAEEAAKRAKEAEEDRARAADDLIRANTPQPQSHVSGVVPPGAVRDSIIAKLGGEIPQIPLNAYYRAASLLSLTKPECKVDWALIAAIGRVETNHGSYRGTQVAPDGSTHPVILGIPLDGRKGTALIRDTDGGALDGDPLYDRAVGPTQFIPSTWRTFAADGNGDGVADPHNMYDAALATGGYLCATAGGPIDVPANASRAVYAYNRSTEYNIEVLTLADHYRRTLDPSLPPLVPPPAVPPDPGNLPPPASPTTPTTTVPGTPTTTFPPTSSSTTTTTEAPPEPSSSTTTSTPDESTPP